MDDINTKETIYSFSDIQWSPAFELQLAGKSCCSGKYLIARPPGATFVFEYVESGTGTLEVDDAKYYPSAGDFYIAPAWHKHRYYSSENDPWIKYWINIRGLLPDSLLEAYQLDGKWLYKESGKAGRLLRDTVLALPEIERREIAAFMEERVFQIIRLLSQSAHLKPLPVFPGPAEKLTAWLRSRLTRKTPSLEEMAEQIGCSPVHTIRLFKAATGYTPVDYLLKEKISLARELLRSTRKPLKEIADSLGFSDEFYFSRQFTKRCGMPPAAFRKKYR